MKARLSDLPTVGVPSPKFETLTPTQLAEERRRAKAEEARFVDALRERGLPTRATTPRDVDEIERKRHRIARLDKKTRGFYRHLIAWRRYIRLINRMVKTRWLRAQVKVAKQRLANKQNTTSDEVRTAQARRAAQLKDRASVLAQVNKLRSDKARYEAALVLWRRRRAASAPSTQVLALTLLRIVVTLQPSIRGARVGKMTRGLTLEDVEARLRVAVDADAREASAAVVAAKARAALKSESYEYEVRVAEANLRSHLGRLPQP